ncbi:DUF4209 domain-containing protein [Bacillus toyonensis]|uniref:DUF4209 domain-containing protein n=1 Tax=Bacillus toyonensis TaxID=155322 RepID=UPI0021D03A7A|nr:DUF4209 domain-containing protein [Bacillus toyonensis]MCU5584154.1 DUF4209 domain-containing protein [Bacillus toyonensis]
MTRKMWEEINNIECNIPVGDVYFVTIKNELDKILETLERGTKEYLEVEVLRDLFLLMPDFEDHAEPYKPLIVLNNGRRSISLEDFNDDMKDTLNTMIESGDLKSPFILFRVMDVCLILNKNYSMRKDLLLQLSSLIDYCFSHNMYHASIDFLNRGFQLFGGEVKNRKKLIEKLDLMIGKYNIDQSLEDSIETLLHGSFKLIEKYQFIKDDKYPQVSFRIAKVFEREKKFNAAIVWWEISINLFNRLNQKESAKKCKENKAFNYYNWAEEELEREKVNYFIVVNRMMSAILTLRQVGEHEELVEGWTRQNNEYQKKSLDHLKKFEVTIDISMDLKEIESQIVNKNFMEILWLIGDLASSLDYNNALNKAIGNNYFLEKIFPVNKLNADGKSTYVSQDEDEFPRSLVDLYNEYYSTAAGKITHLINLLQERYFIRTDYLLAITERNAFVPNGREEIMAYGLREGLKNNYVASLSILIPQFENSIRYFLKENGQNLTSIADDHTEEEKTLSALLKNEKLEGILGQNIVKDLQHLFVNKGGENLRNKLAHGLMSQGEFCSPPCIYAFAKMLNIIFFFKLL